MSLLESLGRFDHEQLIVLQNRAAGLRGFIAIHDTTCGPALGGVRIRRYASEEEALGDVLRLSRGMTYKAALAELPCGGAKAVIMDHEGLERGAAFEAFGQAVENLGGRFYTGRDVGITDADVASIARATRYVADESSAALGDISEHTAIGVWHGLRACLEAAGIAVRGARVALQGVGSVGLLLARILHREGAELILADVDAARAQAAVAELGASLVAPKEIQRVACDVFSPCALGGVLAAETLPLLRARIICGCANNQLAMPDAADELKRRGILYAPDYLVNAGGLIRGAEFYLLQRADSQPSLARIYDRMQRVIALSRESGKSTARIADELAESRLKPGKTYRDCFWPATSLHAHKSPSSI
jgi:leucine dehydrogenase